MTPLQLTKRLLKQTAPGLFNQAKAINKQYRFRHGHGGSEYRAKMALVKRYGKRVVTGPFQGMMYGDNVACSAYVAKLVGSYEEEIHSAVQEAISKRPNIIVDVGCAEGYYAVGLAKLVPDATVYAYDIDRDAQTYCSELAALNGVTERVVVRGLCNHAELATLASRKTFILCDCEGFESELLNPILVPDLENCDILVELHEFLSPGMTQALLKRFERTHSIRLVDTRERDVNDYAALECVAPQDRAWAVREGRPASMQWAYLCAKQT